MFFLDLLLRLLPAAVTTVFSGALTDGGDGKERGRRGFLLMTAVIGTIHFLLYFLLRCLLLHNRDVFGTVRKIAGLRFSYQDIRYFTCSFLISMAAAVVLGKALKTVVVFIRKDSRERSSFERKWKVFLFLSFALTGMVAVGCSAVSLSGAEHVVINEVCGNNLSYTLDENETVSDYIELYNTGRLACRLEGLYLSDSETVPEKKEIPACELPAGGYLLIPLNDRSFSLKKEGGETIYLSDASGKVLDMVTVEASGMDYSCARLADGDPVWSVLSCTPGMANETAVRPVKSPALSHESGFYQNAFYLELSSEPGTEIYYTLDGSVPTAESFLYQAPIYVYDRSFEENVYRSVPNVTQEWLKYQPDETPVDKAFVVRAVAVAGEGETMRVSRPVTATYLVNLEKYRQRPVVSLVADPKQLFGPDGIYVSGGAYDAWYLRGQEGEIPELNFWQHGREWEIPAVFEYFSDTLNLSQDAGLRINGGGIRFLPLKNFSIYARKEYGGSATFDKEIFGNAVSHKIALRGGLANVVCQQLAKDRNVAVQNYIPVSVFLNGEFWYHTNLLEKYDDYYFWQRYGVDRDNLILLNGGELKEGEEEDLAFLEELYAFLDTHDMSDPSDYEAFCRMVDIQSYIDYMCVNIYADNMDFDDEKNVVMWRSRTVTSNPCEDGRWRWALYDLDALEWDDAEIWGCDSQAEKNTFYLKPRFIKQRVEGQTIFKALRNNPNFVRQFVLTFTDLANTDFQYERVKAALDAYGYDPAGYQGGNNGEAQPLTYYYDFFRDRASHILPYMAIEFQLSGQMETVTLSVNDASEGTVTLNTITPDLTNGPWSGQYFIDFFVTATAVPNKGYEFVRWEKTGKEGGAERMDYEESTVEFPVEKGGIRLNAVFKKVE